MRLHLKYFQLLLVAGAFCDEAASKDLFSLGCCFGGYGWVAIKIFTKNF